jgi:hypothetical protein
VRDATLTTRTTSVKGQAERHLEAVRILGCDHPAVGCHTRGWTLTMCPRCEPYRED